MSTEELAAEVKRLAEAYVEASIAHILNRDNSWERERDAFFEAIDRLAAFASKPDAAPIDMVLHCPKCGMQHVDKPEPVDRVFKIDNGVFVPDTLHRRWENPPHKSHLCHGCGHIWRPADVPTNGVAATRTKGKADSPISSSAAPAGLSEMNAVLGHEDRRLVHGARTEGEASS